MRFGHEIFFIKMIIQLFSLKIRGFFISKRLIEVKKILKDILDKKLLPASH